MEILEYINELSAIKKQLEMIEKSANVKAQLIFQNDAFWNLIFYDNTGTACYEKELYSTTQVERHLDAIQVGINLAQGKEI